jgi:hypothetical protein
MELKDWKSDPKIDDELKNSYKDKGLQLEVQEHAILPLVPTLCISKLTVWRRIPVSVGLLFKIGTSSL